MIWKKIGHGGAGEGRYDFDGMENLGNNAFEERKDMWECYCRIPAIMIYMHYFPIQDSNHIYSDNQKTFNDFCKRNCWIDVIN